MWCFLRFLKGSSVVTAAALGARFARKLGILTPGTAVVAATVQGTGAVAVGLRDFKSLPSLSKIFGRSHTVTHKKDQKSTRDSDNL